MEDSDEDLRKYGLRIYTIIKNGPLYNGGAKELSDFIIPSEEVMTRQIDFEEWVQTHANQEVTITLYSLLTKKFRDIKITTNPIGSKDGILGASVKKENWTIANKNILHIISVEKNSFAEKELGLIPLEDYIVGVRSKKPPIISLNQEGFTPLEILGEAIRKNKGKLMKFYIYNKNNGARDVTVTIGNDYYFSLGCEGASGALHMFPSFDNNENKTEENNFEREEKIKGNDNSNNNTNVKQDNDNNIKVSENNSNNTKNDNDNIEKLDENNENSEVTDIKKESIREKEEINIINNDKNDNINELQNKIEPNVINNNENNPLNNKEEENTSKKDNNEEQQHNDIEIINNKVEENIIEKEEENNNEEEKEKEKREEEKKEE